ncbi:MAG: efflux RND transporter periplasmic adaptor subunit [Anaerolineaceae bacterium]|nr:efflux RND transporter periplasmic adaptor subunit [Anaerolineaceae bacterium]
MKKWIKTTIVLLVVAAVIAAVIFGLPVLQQNRQEKAITAAAEKALENTVYARVDDLTSTVGATGAVRAEQTATIFWQTSGVVESLFVEVGDLVSDGDKLAELSKTSLSQAIINAQSELANAEKALDDLMSSDSAAAAAQLELVQAQQAYDDAVDDRSSKQYQRVTNLTLDELRAEWLLAQNAVQDAEDLYEHYEDRNEDDPVRLSVFSQLTAARKSEERALANYNYALGGPDTQEISEADAFLAVAEARLADAQREWERIKDGPAAEDILSAQARIDSAKATLKTAYVEATFNGTITDVSIKEGDFVNAGTPAFRIDNLEHLYVDAYVLEVDINSVEVGQSVEVEFDANPGQIYEGVVTEVGSVGEPSGSQVQFKVTIEVLNANGNVKPGMTANVTIITQRLESVLLVPNQTLKFEEDGVYVSIVKAFSVEDIKIETGASAGSFTEVVSGDLKDGDELLLNLPDTTDGVREVMGEGGRPGGMFFGGE